jgi:uncharacterized protein (UPF0548 family)
MFSLRKPSAETIRTFLASLAGLEYTYAAVGATATVPPSGYVVDHTRVRLGTGRESFMAARAALARWEQFNLGWMQAFPADNVITANGLVAVAARSLGLWTLAACRIVYVVDDDGPVKRSGFAYGTLPGHPESGEERFLVEWKRDDDSVWYDILAFSRPRQLMARLGYPWIRRLQKQFGRQSAESMLRAVAVAQVLGKERIE